MLVVGRGLSARRKAPRCAKGNESRYELRRRRVGAYTSALARRTACGERVESIDIDLWR